MVATRTGFELESATYHRDSDTFRYEFDPDAVPASMAVVAALSEAMETDPLELDPIQTIVDTDALDAIARNYSSADGDLEVTFSLENHTVTVHGHGEVAVAPSDGARPDDWSEGV